MSMPARVALETWTHPALLGAGLWDVVGGRLVSDGLVVRLHAPGRAAPPVDATPNRLGIHVVHRLPGGASAALAPLLMEVRDTRGRFIPFVLRIPAAPAGPLAGAPCTGEISAGPARVPPDCVPLFRAPSSPTPAGLAVVRASLRYDHAPAAFALLELRASGQLLARGLADARGEIAAFLAWPQPEDAPLWSPPAPPQRPRPLAEQTWSLGLTVRFRPGLPRHVVTPGLDPLPELCEVAAQPPAVASTAPAGPALVSATLHYGEDLVLGADAGTSELFLQPA